MKRTRVLSKKAEVKKVKYISSSSESEEDNEDNALEGNNILTHEENTESSDENKKSSDEENESIDENKESIDEGHDEEPEKETTTIALKPNIGLANVMNKILNVNIPAHKPIILLKSKTKQDIPNEDTGLTHKEEIIKSIEKRKLKKEWEDVCLVKPSALDRDRERTLSRIATRGVVQLFNAVKQQQKSMTEKLKEAGPSEGKRGKMMNSVTKKDFLELLKATAAKDSSGNKTESTPSIKKKDKKPKEPEKPEKPAWSVLRDDFMIGAKMKDWDKISDNEESNESEKDHFSDASVDNT